jgi:hypothetical protein
MYEYTTDIVRPHVPCRNSNSNSNSNNITHQHNVGRGVATRDGAASTATDINNITHKHNVSHGVATRAVGWHQWQCHLGIKNILVLLTFHTSTVSV